MRMLTSCARNNSTLYAKNAMGFRTLWTMKEICLHLFSLEKKRKEKISYLEQET